MGKKYFLQQKAFSLKDKYNVYDEDEEIIYKISSNFQLINFQCSIKNSQDEECLKVISEVMNVIPKYQIVKNNFTVAKVKKKVSFLKHRFEISSEYGNFKIENNGFMSLNFNLWKDNLIIANISKEFIKLTDYYVIDILEDIQPEFVVALVITIDNALYNGNNSF